jgi:hypothetical protein
MFHVHFFHDLQILLTVSFCLIVQFSLAYSKYLTLIVDTQRTFRGYQSFVGIGIPNFSDARFAKSNFISNFPIFSYRAFSVLLLSSSDASLLSKTILDFSKNSSFHFEITAGDTSYFFANSARVSRSLNASTDTRALNSALNFLLFCFMFV